MIKITINGIEMEVVGIRKDKLLCEYLGESCYGLGETIRKPTYKIRKTKKGYFIQVDKRIYIDEQLKDLLKPWISKKITIDKK